ncbi:unnamed protein product [Didymodactylos carnosus]|uniref:Uncharacterized protein n=1 Tax=Didymodactylos carnosus TaxID=1234261 RepID=A0A8S2GA77_9BILA|nr:unnamed protein product [Didymodactylos carnosus]CAF4485427.1 unnamed protein product [Didymodactylos carnosus]
MICISLVLCLGANCGQVRGIPPITPITAPKTPLIAPKTSVIAPKTPIIPAKAPAIVRKASVIASKTPDSYPQKASAA